MKRLEDFEDSPLVPALLMKLHEDADKVLMNASRFFRFVDGGSNRARRFRSASRAV